MYKYSPTTQPLNHSTTQPLTFGKHGAAGASHHEHHREQHGQARQVEPADVLSVARDGGGIDDEAEEEEEGHELLGATCGQVVVRWWSGGGQVVVRWFGLEWNGMVVSLSRFDFRRLGRKRVENEGKLRAK